jgi:hypothetical protein
MEFSFPALNYAPSHEDLREVEVEVQLHIFLNLALDGSGR